MSKISGAPEPKTTTHVRPMVSVDLGIEALGRMRRRDPAIGIMVHGYADDGSATPFLLDPTTQKESDALLATPMKEGETFLQALDRLVKIHLVNRKVDL